MRNASRNAELAPIPFELVPLTPLPEATEVSLAEWDKAVCERDADTPDGRARALAEVRE